MNIVKSSWQITCDQVFFIPRAVEERDSGNKGRQGCLFNEFSVASKLNSVKGAISDFTYCVIGMKIKIYEKSCFYCGIGIVILSGYGYLSISTQTLFFTDLAVTAKMLE